MPDGIHYTLVRNKLAAIVDRVCAATLLVIQCRRHY